MGGTTAWVLGDQLSRDLPSLDAADRVLMVESHRRIERRPVHRRKLVFLLSAMRHRAEELRGDFDVDYRAAADMSSAIGDHVREHRPDRLVMVGASEYRGRRFQESVAERVGVPCEILPNTQMLVERFDPQPDAGPDQQIVMEHFYRAMRRHFDLLMDGGEPCGGRWNFDEENRKGYPKSGLEPPATARFTPDAITLEVMDEVAALDGYGSVDGFELGVTAADASSAFGSFVQHGLADFGAYEDAMAVDHGHLFHSVMAQYMNVGLIDPLGMARTVERAYRDGRAPINSAEGFVRQVVGWREFVYWNYWRLMPDLETSNAWDHHRPVPEWWWSGETDMRCLATVIGRVVETGYSHHIERLMVLCNFAMLAGLDPAEVNEWFLSMYVDAYEWVVTPNVIGMGLNADGGIIATKPYIASSNYIDKMSDFCGGCVYDRSIRHGDDACPFNTLYWNFLLEHEDRLRSNPRSGRAVLGLRHLDDDERQAVRSHAADILAEMDG